MARNLKEGLRVFQENVLTDFTLWLAMISLTIEDSTPENPNDKSAITRLRDYISQLDSELIISGAPHRGHTDAVMIRKFIQMLVPEIQARNLFVAAQDTFAPADEKASRKKRFMSRLKLLFVESIIGKFHQFDRVASQEDAVATIEELTFLLTGFDPLIGYDPVHGDKTFSISIFPQGTRKVGTPVGTSLVPIANFSQRPILALNFSNEAANVLPKLADNESTPAFITKKILRRIRYLFTAKHNYQVTLTVGDFIEYDEDKKVMLRRFLKAHRADKAGNILDSSAD